MTIHTIPSAGDHSDIERQIEQLRTALALVESMSGEPVAMAPLQLQLQARNATVARRIAAIVAETAAIATAGIEALLAHQARHGTEPKAAAVRLAAEIRRGLGEAGRV